MSEMLKLNNGLEIPEQGFGTYSYTDNLHEIIPMAAKAGVRLFDTSDDYGNEAYLGSALHSTFSNRDDYMVITKFTKPTHPNDLETLLRESLKHLFGDSSTPVDLYLMHWPFPNVYQSIWREMEKVYQKGLCKGIGVCNFNVEHLEQLCKNSNIIPVVNQFELHPLFNQKELCDYCSDHGIQVMCYSPLARMNPALVKNETLLEIADRHNKSMVQIILRWDYQQRFIAIPAGSKQKHIEDNMNILSFELSAEEMSVINSLNYGMRVRNDPKTYFSAKQKAKFLAADCIYKFGSVIRKLV